MSCEEAVSFKQSAVLMLASIVSPLALQAKQVVHTFRIQKQAMRSPDGQMDRCESDGPVDIKVWG